MEFLDFFSQERYSGASRIYLAPNIPKKLLNNALDSYGLDVDPTDILALIDDTMLGSGKDGCLIGRSDIAFKEAFSDPIAFTVAQMKALEINGSKVLIDGKKVSAFTLPDKADLQQFFALFGKWLAGVEPSQARVPKKTSAPPIELSAEQISALSRKVLDAARRFAPERVFAHPHIPQKKLQAALASYGGNLVADDVLVLLDDTLFGSAKEGLLFGRETLAMKMVFESPRVFFWRHFEAINVHKRELHINRRKIGSLTQVGEKELGAFFDAINDALLGTLDVTAIAEPQIVAPMVSKTGDFSALDWDADEEQVAEKTTPEPLLVGREVVAKPERIETAQASNKSSTKDKLLGYIGSAIEQNKSKILPFVKEKTGTASLAALRNDENIEKVAGILYAFLPGFVRLALKEHVFVGFVLEHRTKILDKLLQGEEEPKAALNAPATPAMLGFDDALNDLLGEEPIPASTGGRRSLDKMQAVARRLKDDVAEDPNSELVLGLPVSMLQAVLVQAETLASQEGDGLEDHILFALAFMYGFSFHKIPEALRKQDNVFEAFFVGLIMICEYYQEQPEPSVDTEGQTIPLAYAMAKVINKAALNDMVRQMLQQGKAAQTPNEFDMDTIMGLLRQANHLAEQWVAALTRDMLEEEMTLQSRWGDVLN